MAQAKKPTTKAPAKSQAKSKTSQDKAEAPPRQKNPIPSDTRKYESTGNYNPKAPHTVATWEGILEKLPCTLADMADVEHKNPGFVGYLIRRKAIQPVK